MRPRHLPYLSFAQAAIVLCGAVGSVLAQAPLESAAFVDTTAAFADTTAAFVDTTAAIADTTAAIADTTIAHAALTLAKPVPLNASGAERDIVLRPAIPAYFPGCDDVPEGDAEKLACATGKLMRYISRELTYPEVAREEGIQGVTVLTFVITDEGVIEDVTVLRDIGGGCGAEAQRILAAMPQWEPAIHDGDSVHTQFMLPITFGLRGNLYDYRLQPGALDGEVVTREEVIRAATEEEWLAFDPQRKPLTITEAVYTVERGGEKDRLITRGTDRPDAKALSKFLGRRPARLSIEVNVVDGLDIRTVTRQFVMVR